MICMKRLTVLAVLIVCTISATAQTYWDNSRPNHRFGFGVRAGANFAKQNNMDDGEDRNFRTGFHAGAELDINIIRSLSVNIGAMYIQKGFKAEYSDYRGSLKTTDNASWIEVPVLASYRVELSDVSQFQFNVGPYFAFGLSGKQKVKSTFPGQDSYEIDCFDQYDGTKKFDTGFSIGAAIVYSNMFFGANYERSLINISNSNDRFVNGCIAVTIGYNFK